MIPPTIWNQLIETLEESGKLTYVKTVFSGFRFDIEPEGLPCLMIEPTGNGEPERRMNNIDYQYLDLDIYAISDNSPHNFEKTIVGDELYKGILDIENDVRGCLKNSYTLGDTVTDIRIQPTIFGDERFGNYPIRGFRMPVRILYKQQDGV